jgi:hypothetical protein
MAGGGGVRLKDGERRPYKAGQMEENMVPDKHRMTLNIKQSTYENMTRQGVYAKEVTEMLENMYGVNFSV